MLTRLHQQASNFSAAGLRFGGRSRRIAAVACLVALCGVIFGVGAAVGRPSGRGFAPRGALVSMRAGTGLGAHAAVKSHGRRRGHAHKHARRLFMRRMAVRAHRAHHAHARMARDARRRAAKRHHHRPHHRAKAKRHPRVVHALMARDFSPALTSATAALGQSVTALAGVSSHATPAPRALTAGSGRLISSGQVDALTGQVRAYSISSRSTAHGGAAATGHAHAKPVVKPGHNGSAHGSGGGFSLPFMPAPSQIEQFVTVIPKSLWIGFASALLLAAAGGTAALGYRRRAHRQASEYAAVAAVALTDPLTGVLNRRGFGEAVERELARARRYGSPFALAYVDIRGLKAVNDSEGHLAGDEVIQRVSKLLGESVRTEDAVGRLGGDELALLLTGPSAHGREAVVERIQSRVPDYREAMGIDTPWDVTVGTASYPADGATFEELVSTADRRLYEQRGIQLR